MTIPDVARACGLSDSTIRSIIERKAKRVSLDVAFKLQKGLNVSMNRLNGEKEEKLIPEIEDKLSEIELIIRQLSPDNRAKLLELSRLFLDAQNKNEENR